MVQSYKGQSWNFPGGKLDPGEEIGKIGWVELVNLIGWDNDTDAKTRGKIFFGVKPFVEGIRRWVNIIRRSRGMDVLASDGAAAREGRSLVAGGPGGSRTD